MKRTMSLLLVMTATLLWNPSFRAKASTTDSMLRGVASNGSRGSFASLHKNRHQEHEATKERTSTSTRLRGVSYTTTISNSNNEKNNSKENNSKTKINSRHRSLSEMKDRQNPSSSSVSSEQNAPSPSPSPITALNLLELSSEAATTMIVLDPFSLIYTIPTPSSTAQQQQQQQKVIQDATLVAIATQSILQRLVRHVLEPQLEPNFDENWLRIQTLASPGQVSTDDETMDKNMMMLTLDYQSTATLDTTIEFQSSSRCTSGNSDQNPQQYLQETICQIVADGSYLQQLPGSLASTNALVETTLVTLNFWNNYTCPVGNATNDDNENDNSNNGNDNTNSGVNNNNNNNKGDDEKLSLYWWLLIAAGACALLLFSLYLFFRFRYPQTCRHDHCDTGTVEKLSTSVDPKSTSQKDHDEVDVDKIVNQGVVQRDSPPRNINATVNTNANANDTVQDSSESTDNIESNVNSCLLSPSEPQPLISDSNMIQDDTIHSDIVNNSGASESNVTSDDSLLVLSPGERTLIVSQAQAPIPVNLEQVYPEENPNDTVSNSDPMDNEHVVDADQLEEILPTDIVAPLATSAAPQEHETAENNHDEMQKEKETIETSADVMVKDATNDTSSESGKVATEFETTIETDDTMEPTTQDTHEPETAPMAPSSTDVTAPSSTQLVGTETLVSEDLNSVVSATETRSNVVSLGSSGEMTNSKLETEAPSNTLQQTEGEMKSASETLNESSNDTIQGTGAEETVPAELTSANTASPTFVPDDSKPNATTNEL